MKDSPEFVITADGSHTLFLPEMNEHYHSTFGAIAESTHVFIRNGLDLFPGPDLTIFEVGFGTGLNAFLTAIRAKDRGMRITYCSIEKFPLDEGTAENLNYPGLLMQGSKPSFDLFRAIHKVPWNQPVFIQDGFCLHKISGDILNFMPDFPYDLIYFDAFSPDKQPEMWTGEIMHKIILRLNPGGILTTYCAKGAVRRMLKENGLSVERLPGPPGKREILRGIKL